MYCDEVYGKANGSMMGGEIVRGEDESVRGLWEENE